jgi:hypothetical protein
MILLIIQFNMKISLLSKLKIKKKKTIKEKIYKITSIEVPENF